MKSSEEQLATQLRFLAPRVLASLLRKERNFALVEDAVQEALLTAALDWPEKGSPEDPLAWLVFVASRRFSDLVRSEVRRKKREEIAISLAPSEGVALAFDAASSSADDVLLLLFGSCHPSLPSASAIALTLRSVFGLTTREIASAYHVPEATMAARILRAKNKLAELREPFERPDAAAQELRLPNVLRILYLIFNEGYVASHGNSLDRPDLANEGIRLTKLLREALPEEGEVTGLLALMLLSDARRPARTGNAGELVPLDEQNRSLWDREKIAEGTTLLERALAQRGVGIYRIQAAVSALHDDAPDYETTDWPQILALYELHLAIEPSPMARLSHAIAAAMVHGAEKGLTLLDELEKSSEPHYRIDAARGHLLERVGRLDEARPHFERAAILTNSLPERHFLLMKMASLTSS